MYHLQFEELESRRLLNGTGFASQPPPTHSSPADTSSAWMAERSPGDHSSGYVDSYNHGWSGWGGAERGSLAMNSSPGFRGSTEVVVIVYVVVVQNPDTPSPAPTSPGATSPGAGPVAVVPFSVSPGPGPSLQTARITAGSLPLDVIDLSRGAPATAGEASSAGAPERANPQAPPVSQDLLAATGPGATGQGLSTARSPIWAGREGQEGDWLPDSAGPRPQPSTSRFEETPSTTGPAEVQPVPSAPQAAGVLTALPSVGLSVLEHGMQQFLKQLERLDEQPAPPAEETWSYLWIVAGASAVAACEIARRQWRRPVEMPALVVNRLPGSAPDEPVEG